jgi:hypothetical protein
MSDFPPQADLRFKMGGVTFLDADDSGGPGVRLRAR